jgi:hypothetical protein
MSRIQQWPVQIPHHLHSTSQSPHVHMVVSIPMHIVIYRNVLRHCQQFAWMTMRLSWHSVTLFEDTSAYTLSLPSRSIPHSMFSRHICRVLSVTAHTLDPRPHLFCLSIYIVAFNTLAPFAAYQFSVSCSCRVSMRGSALYLIQVFTSPSSDVSSVFYITRTSQSFSHSTSLTLFQRFSHLALTSCSHQSLSHYPASIPMIIISCGYIKDSNILNTLIHHSASRSAPRSTSRASSAACTFKRS